ncbi:MAG: amidohydrolase [Gammaproteobacteria bacterium]|nr:amidohydrolase [Gammaproteobacteria bacterium]MDE2252254.1 amidohydrolase [Gammaproteobacteria bacterium]
MKEPIGRWSGSAAAAALATMLSAGAVAAAQPQAGVPEVAPLLPELEALYRDLHEHPELGFQEQRTAAELAARVRALGYEVTTGVGKTGLVALLRNGPGPTVMLRTELDALPIEEQTGLPFASRATATNAAGAVVPVAHACGHDLHMTAWYGTAKLMAQRRERWRGTLMLVGQPAEEIGDGAAAMLADGLFTRFPKPDFAIGVHDEPTLPSGVVGYRAGYFRAAVDAIEIVVHGRGGHGAYPHLAVDPIVIAARAILGIQTVVSRETDALAPVVVTVGAINGGTAPNIIPDEVRMLLTVRTFDSAVRARVLAAIRRQVDAEATAANAPRLPDFRVYDSADMVYNDPATTARLVAALQRGLGPDSVREMPPQMGAEDFSQYGRAGVRAVLLHVGAVSPEDLASGRPLPYLHSALWAPQLEPTLHSMVAAEVIMLTELLNTAHAHGP